MGIAYIKRVKLVIAICLLQAVLVSNLSAQTFKFANSEASSKVTAPMLKAYGIFPYPVITVWNNDWHSMYNNPSWRSSFKFKSNNSYVKFYVDHTYPQMMTKAYAYKLTYDINGYTSIDTNTSVLSHDTLTIGYNPDSLTAYQEIQLKKYTGYYKIQVTITGLFDITDPSVAPISVRPDTLSNLNFVVEASILTQRYDVPSYYGAGSGTVSTSYTTPTSNNNYIDVTISPSTITPMNYEFEWTYIDDYMRNVSTGTVSNIPLSNLSYDFRYNSTRVWLDTPYFRIPIVYPSGYIVFRARGVRPDSNLFRYPIYTDWSYAMADSGALSSIGSSAYYQISSPYSGDSLNWQYTISFAEGGKYKHVLSFYDGLLKNRESITRFNNTPDKLIVTQNIYDYEGRPSIKILPTPVDNSSFSYQYNVSLNSNTNLPYQAGDFDTIRTQSCPSEALLAPLANNALANIYYSHYNPDTTTGSQMYVPDAQGYPLVHTIYEPGFNDRVEKQGGAGLKLQIADSNIITNDYVGANQQDLDHVFGENIGYSGFYTKTVSRDPNRQLSLTIKDYKGKLIETTMIGTGPNSLNHAIVPIDNLPDTTYYNEDIIGSYPQRIIGNRRIVDKDFYMDVEGNDSIQYVYSFTPYPTGCDSSFLSVKASYYYDVIDQCGNMQYTESGILGNTGVVKTNTPVPYSGTKHGMFLAQGKFNLNKTLTVNTNDIYAAVDSFFAHPNCLHDQPYFIRQSVERQSLPCPGVDGDECAKAKIRMMQELYPNLDSTYADRKYGNYYIDPITGLVKGGNNSILTDIENNTGYKGLRYKDSCIVKLPDSVMGPDGIWYKNLRNIGVDTFIYIFNDQIAEALLPLHPEYCKLQNCFYDSFKTQTLAIPDAATADKLNLLLLDSLVAKDPIKNVLSTVLGFTNPADSLSTFMGGKFRLDSMALVKAYCGCGDSVMFNQCLTGIFSNEIQNRILINDFIKNSYFKDVMGLYFQNRERFKNMITGNAGNTCGPCSDVRMTLVPLPVFPSYYTSTGAISAGPGTVWGAFGGSGVSTGFVSSLAGAIDSSARLSPDTVAMLSDSAHLMYGAADSVLCVGQIDTILNRLSNCIGYSATISAALRNTLDSLCNAHAVQYGDYSPDQIRYVLTRNGINPNDICNPYLINYTSMSPTSSSGADCKPPAFYSDLQGFLNKSTPLAALKACALSSPSTPAAYTLVTSNIFEDSMSTALGTTSVSMLATYTSSSNLYTLKIYKVPATDTIKIFLRGTDTAAVAHNIFNGSPTDTFAITNVICINDQPQQIAVGLISDLSFAATVKHSSTAFSYTTTMLGWVDSVETMFYSSNPIAACIPCTQMRDLYNQFMDTLQVLNVKGTDHPYYEIMLRNFINYKLRATYTSDQLDTFITSCALADSMKLAQYVAYSTFIFNDSASALYFVDSLNNLDAAVGMSPYREDSIAGANKYYKVLVDFNDIPVARLYKFVALVNRYVGYSHVVSHLINSPYSSLQPPNVLGVIYTPTAYSFVPNATTIFGSGTGVTFSSVYTNGLWVGSRYKNQNYYYVYESSGASAYQISRDLYTLQKYIYDHRMPTAFISNYQGTVNNDYFKPEKQGLLSYTYKYQSLPPYEVLDSLQTQYLMSPRVPVMDTETVSYTKPFSAEMIRNLYIANTANTNNLFDTLKKILATVATNTVNPGGIFFDTNKVVVNSGLTAYRCSDGTYWFRYFGPKDTMYNAYVKMPDYIPRYRHKYYQVDSVYSTVHKGVLTKPGDSTSRFYTLVLQIPGDNTSTIQVDGMTDFVIGKNIQLNNVLLNGDLRSSDVPAPPDTFYNCERVILQSAVRMGIIAYNRFLDSMHNALNRGFLAYMMNGVHEQLNVGYRDQQFNTTLYYYDRAGNLTNTIPPAGVVPISMTKLNKADTVRMKDTTVTADVTPAHQKMSTYYYNSRNELLSQQTPDGGKTRFLYDSAGRLIFSQNAKQAVYGGYTYNLYDNQNRIMETGEIATGIPAFDEFYFKIVPPTSVRPSYPYPFAQYPTGGDSILISPDLPMIHNVLTESHQTVIDFVHASYRNDVVMTIYDTMAKKLSLVSGLDDQQNLRKRISCVKYFEQLSPLDQYYNNYIYATHYSYDIDGNVMTLVQEYPPFDSLHQRYKRIDYDYDLVSGKVNMLSYNRAHPDQFYQRYTYDPDNRLTEVETSNDGFVWKRDAGYTYYDHGPLARISVGDLRVQGIDYAYTIQGWLKAVNGDTLTAASDMGKDGGSGSIYAPDVAGGTIDYFSGDYKPITAYKVSHISGPVLNLYNGNIARQTVSIAPFQRLNKQYIYDQLNRIHTANYASIDAVTNTMTGLNDYFNSYKYDQDGNLLQLVRYGNKISGIAHLMDSLIYTYPTGAGMNNQVQVVADTAANMYTNDIAKNGDLLHARYLYDATGNTVKDLVSGQDTVEWNLYNKVTATNNTTAKNSMNFRYDGAGNRVIKSFTQNTDTGSYENDNYCVHDAQGNILAVYHTDRYWKIVTTGGVVSYRPYSGPVGKVDDDGRSGSGGSHNFNHSWTVPVFATDPHFSQALIAYSMQNGQVTGSQLAGRSVAFYTTNNAAIYQKMLYAGTGYIKPLSAYEATAADTPLSAALMQVFDNDDVRYGAKLLGALFSTTSVTKQKHVFNLMCNTGADSMLRYLAAMVPVAAPSTCDSIATNLQQALPLPQTLFELYRRVQDSFPSRFRSYIGYLATDTAIYNDSFYVSSTGALSPVLQDILYTYSDTAKVSKFFSGYSGAAAMLASVADTPTMLRICYASNPEGYINAVNDDMGNAYVDSSIASVPELDMVSYASGVRGATGISVSTIDATTASVLQKQDYYLGEHEIYGSSRLGMKEYWPTQLAYIWDYTGTTPLKDTIRFSVPTPWYSNEYQDLIASTATSPYGNTFTDPYTTQHVLGQRQYELTDHLGDVLATVSDKRVDVDANHDGTIDGYHASIPAAYDYYPFGMLMPGRYVHDTAEHCALLTQTMMVPTWVNVLLTPDVSCAPCGLIAVAPFSMAFAPGNVTVSGGPPGQLLYNFNTVPNVQSTAEVDISSLIGGPFQAAIIDSTGTQQAAAIMQGPNTYIMTYTSPSSANTFQITALAGGGSITLTQATFKQLKYVPGTTTISLCNQSNDNYRFGFNGKEKDNQWAGIGNHVDFGARGFDPRIARWQSVDPLTHKFPGWSPYSFAFDNPIVNIDKEGEKGEDARAQLYEQMGKPLIAKFNEMNVSNKYKALYLIAQKRAETGFALTGRGNIFNITGKGDKGSIHYAATEYHKDGTPYKLAQDYAIYSNNNVAADAYIKLVSGLSRYKDAWGALTNDKATIKDFAEGLQKGGYGTDPNYASKVETIFAGVVKDYKKMIGTEIGNNNKQIIANNQIINSKDASAEDKSNAGKSNTELTTKNAALNSDLQQLNNLK